MKAVRSGAVLVSTKRPDLQPPTDIGQHRHAELAPPAHHEVDDLRGRFLRGANEVSLVLPVFGIHDNDDFATSDGVDSRLNR